MRAPLRLPRVALALAGALAATTLAARPVEAQFGKLKDLGKAAVRGATEKKTEEAVGERAREAAGVPSGARRAPAPTFTEDVLEITETRVAALLRGMDAELAARPAAERRYREAQANLAEAERTYPARQAEYERRRAAWDKASERHEACAAPIRERYERQGEVEAKRGEALGRRMEGEFSDAREKRLESLAARMKAAEQRGDQATMRALADSVQREMAGFMTLAQEGMRESTRMERAGEAYKAELAKCPNPGPEPKAPESPARFGTEDASYVLEQAAAKASGFEAYQYHVMKERVEAWVQILKRRPNARPGGFTDGELAALQGVAARLQGHALFGEGASWSPGRGRS